MHDTWRLWANYQMAEKMLRLEQLDFIHQQLTDMLLAAGYVPTRLGGEMGNADHVYDPHHEKLVCATCGKEPEFHKQKPHEDSHDGGFEHRPDDLTPERREHLKRRWD